jgi:hypothetical protein
VKVDTALIYVQKLLQLKGALQFLVSSLSTLYTV